MKFDIIEIPELSGEKCRIFSIRQEGETRTLLECFLRDNYATYKNEIEDIYNRLKIIGKVEGAREHYFKHNEGSLGDGVSALYDGNKKNIRLYCIRYGTITLILGGGGYKSKDIRAWQEDRILSIHAELMKKISEEIKKDEDVKLLSDGSFSSLNVNNDYE